MKKLLPELVGTAGFCLLSGGLYVWFGAGPALCGAGGLLLVGGFLAARGAG